MGLTILEADLEQDREELIAFLHDNLTPESNDARFNWLYLDSPNGRARAWMAISESGRTIGMAAAFPRSFWASGKVEQVWVLGDFSIHPDYRSLGPALQLQRAILESLSNTSYAVYDFPSPTMMAIYRRLGAPLPGKHVRHVKLIRSDEHVQKWIRRPFLASCISSILNVLLYALQFSRYFAGGVEFSLHEGPFGKEFEMTNGFVASGHRLQGYRSADHLNWRYLRHPFKKYLVVVARKQMQLIGYGILEINQHGATFAELYTKEMPNIVAGIVLYAASVLRKTRISSISMPLLENCHLVPLLRSAGFYPRESVPVIAHATSAAKCTSDDMFHIKNWFLVHGDRES